jgi:hypothetical protein
MASAEELLASTQEFREKTVADIVTDNIPLLKKLKNKGNIKVMGGGRQILEPARLSQNAFVQRINETEEIDLGANPVLNEFLYSPKIIVVPTIITDLEMAQNQGDEAVVDLLDEKLDISEASLMNNVEFDLQSDGTSFGGKGFAGIQTYIPVSNSTGTVGGLSRVTYPQLRNESGNLPVVFGSATDASNIEQRLRFYKNRVVLDNKGPDFCLAGEDFFSYAQDAASAKQRFVSQKSELVEAGFDVVSIAGMEIVLANGKSFSGLARIPAKRAYGINCKTMRLRMYRGYNFEQVKKRTAVNQLIEASIIVGIGQFTTNNPGVNFVAYDV